MRSRCNRESIIARLLGGLAFAARRSLRIRAPADVSSQSPIQRGTGSKIPIRSEGRATGNALRPAFLVRQPIHAKIRRLAP
jgi:hypothetical protein